MCEGWPKILGPSVLSILFRTVILLKISSVVNVSKSEFTLRKQRNWQRSFLDITLRVISDQSSIGRFMVMSGNSLGPAGGEDERGIY